MVEREIVYCESGEHWLAWLAEHAAENDGIALAIAKKDCTRPSVTYLEAIDGALRFGWIDGQRNRLDDDHFLQNFGPRRARSIWSLVNRDKALALIEAGLMQPAGLAEVEKAKSDGRWERAYAGSKTIEVPDDLAAALSASPEAAAFFATLTGANRYAILFRLGNVKLATTRERKIGEYVAMLERGETIY